MFQPFEVFKQDYIRRLIGLKKFYLVTQTYTRGPVDTVNEKIVLLITDYDNPGLAKIHWNAVKHDKYAAVINLNNANHLAKITEMAGLGSAYILYWSMVKDVNELHQRLTTRYTENIRRFLATNTLWRIGADEKITTRFEVTFGELFIIIKRRSNNIRIKFEDIEKV